jgi:hypothetical protein
MMGMLLDRWRGKHRQHRADAPTVAQATADAAPCSATAEPDYDAMLRRILDAIEQDERQR